MAYECPNKRTMIMRDGEWTTNSEDDKEKSHKKKEIVHYGNDGEGKISMTMRILGYPLKEEEASTQRENIFYTRCKVEEAIL